MNMAKLGFGVGCPLHRNNPVNAIDPLGLCEEGQAWKSKGQRGECVPEAEAGYLPGNAAEDFVENCPLPQVKGASILGTIGKRIISKVVTKSAANFADKSKLAGHFEKHGAEFGAKSADEYLSIAQDVMKNGTKVQYPYKGETRTGYVQLMGNNRKGQSKFAFVGANSQGQITTLHSNERKGFLENIK